MARGEVDVVDDNVLRRVVPGLVDDPAAQLIDARAERIVGGDGQGLGVYRVRGTARLGDEARCWSAIVKVLPSAGDQPGDHWCYAEREVRAYRSGLIANLAGGLESPKCLAAQTDQAGRHHLWLEDLGSQDAAWTIERHACAARCLGRFNAAYLAEATIPDLPWLSRRWLRGWLAESAHAVETLPRYRDHPLVRRVYPPQVMADIVEVWRHRERLLDALDRLPRTLCHNDAFRRNLAWRADELLGLDWAFIGPGPIGAELSPLVSATVAFAEVRPEDRSELEEAVVSAYLTGLHDAGWRGSTDQVWLGYAATSLLRYGPGTVRLVAPALLDPSVQKHVAEVLGMSFDAVVDHWATVIREDVRLRARIAPLVA